jgi:hypothetical protein
MRIPIFNYHFREEVKTSPENPPKPDIKERIAKLRTDDNELFSHVFGAGVSKGQKEINQAAVNALNDDEKKLLRDKLTDMKIHQVIRQQAKDLNFIDPEDAVERLQNSLTLNDKLEVVTVVADEEVPAEGFISAYLDKLAKRAPHLVKSTQIAGQGSGHQVPRPPGQGSTKRIYTRKELSDGAFYEANRIDIGFAINEGRIKN